MKKILFVVTLTIAATICSFARSQDDLEECQFEPFQINAEELSMGTSAAPLSEAEEALEQAVQMMNFECLDNRDIELTGEVIVPPGWLMEDTYILLSDVVKEYPESESAVEAQLRLSYILRETGKEPAWGEFLLGEVAELHGERWEGQFASYYLTTRKIEGLVYVDEFLETIDLFEDIEQTTSSLESFQESASNPSFSNFIGDIYWDISFEINYYLLLGYLYCGINDVPSAIGSYNFVLQNHTDYEFYNTLSAEVADMNAENICFQAEAQNRE